MNAIHAAGYRRVRYGILGAGVLALALTTTASVVQVTGIVGAVWLPGIRAA